MKRILITAVLFFAGISVYCQVDISGEWVGKINYLPESRPYDSLVITLRLKADGNKITGESHTISSLGGGFFADISVSGKFYKKMNGFWVQQETVLKKNFSLPAVFFLERFDINFIDGNPDQWEGKATCLRAIFSSNFCHGDLPITFTRK